MKPRCLLCALLIGLGVTFSGCGIARQIHVSSQHEATLQLRQGMRPAEVEAILGKPTTAEVRTIGTQTKQPFHALVWSYSGLILYFENPTDARLNSWTAKQ